MLRLKSYANHPPGGFGHPELPTLNGTLDIVELSRRLSDFRKGNSLPRSGVEECFKDIDTHVANRIRGTVRRWKDWVIDTDEAAYVAALPKVGGCSGCGAKVK